MAIKKKQLRLNSLTIVSPKIGRDTVQILAWDVTINTGVVDHTKLYIDNARSGLFDPNIGIDHWSLEGWKNLHLTQSKSTYAHFQARWYGWSCCRRRR